MTEKTRSLVILRYEGRDTAGQAMFGLERLEAQGHVKLADVVVVHKTPRLLTQLSARARLGCAKSA